MRYLNGFTRKTYKKQIYSVLNSLSTRFSISIFSCVFFHSVEHFLCRRFSFDFLYWFRELHVFCGGFFKNRRKKRSLLKRWTFYFDWSIALRYKCEAQTYGIGFERIVFFNLFPQLLFRNNNKKLVYLSDEFDCSRSRNRSRRLFIPFYYYFLISFVYKIQPSE